MSKNSVSRAGGGVVQRVNRKASEGRGWKRASRVVWLHDQLLNKFLMLRSMSIKVSRSILIDAARLLHESSDTFGAKTMKNHHFLERHDVVERKQCGKVDVSEEKHRRIERAAAYHLGVLKRAYQADPDDELILNTDETHFVVNMDGSKTLEKRGAPTVKNHDVVSGLERKTLVVLLLGGRNARVEVPMIVFQNGKCSHPIRGISDDVSGMTYRTGSRGSKEQNAISSLQKRVMVDTDT
ncbi:hypothetical protein PybrP1_003655 [[Pythium] brassicae (nom. inval.)]|nr:hypothetical protein PybrP1_003655 [[Pythium] brassicae (nom. inval.)]